MNERIKDAIRKIVFQLQEKKMDDIQAFIGFDACIDNIIRIVRNKNEKNETEFYTNSRQFGEFLISRENKSCGVELRTQLSKIGGNMVITGNSLGHLGFTVDCIGTFGLPEIWPVFRSMSSNCTLYTVGDPVTTSALEFNDAKVMMFDPAPYDKLTWNGIKDLIGIDRIRQLMSGKQLICFLNWSEIENTSLIWEGILDEVLLPTSPSEIQAYFFTDFADCSRRSKKEILLALDLISRFRNYFKAIISLNQNEAEIIAKALDLPENDSDEKFIKTLFHALRTDELVIHRTRDALAYDGITFKKFDTFFCEEPKILTGGGDNFNAGFCFARIYGFDLLQSLIVANAVSGYYVKIGSSPEIANLADFLCDNLNGNTAPH